MSEGISLVLPSQKEKQQQQQQLGLPFQEHHQQQQPFPLLFNSNSSNNNNKEKLLSSPVSTSTSAPTHQHYFPDFTTRMSIYPHPHHHHHHHLPTATTTTTATTGNWNSTIVAATHHHHHHTNHDHDDSDADEEDPEEDEDDDVDDDDDEDDNDNDDHDHHIPPHDTTNDDDCNNSNKSTAISTMDKMGNGNGKPNFGNIMGPIGEVIMVKDGSATGCGQMATPNSNNNNAGGMVTIAETNRDLSYSRYLHHTTEGSGGEGARGRDMVSLNSSVFSVRKEKDKEKEVPGFVTGSGDSLRLILSDPVTGALMDDAVILPCGHSFGGGGIQHVTKMKACFTCSRSISEDSISPNLSLQAAVQAFRREEESRRSFKRRRERSDQDRGTNGDLNVMDSPRGRGVQFPFALAEKVIIKGNKRTPQRFIGREAVVTTQCLNGWYVVKTLDNAESVKLQYRSLAKVSDESSSMAMSSKVAPNWLS